MRNSLSQKLCFSVILISALSYPLSCLAEALKGNEIVLTQEELLGQKIFSDTRLSNPVGQSCTSCHSPSAAFSDPRTSFATSIGSNSNRFGGRNAPTAMYMRYSKALKAEIDEGHKIYEGGFFWDGRAQSLEEQAKGPFLNPLEMAASDEYVVRKVCQSTDYGNLFRSVFGQEICDLNPEVNFSIKIQKAYNAVASALASFEKSDVLAPFSSKFDKVMAHKDSFTEAELRGFNLFKNEKKANCAACHTVEIEDPKSKALFTDFTYDNLGVPANDELLQLNHAETDFGLMITTRRVEDDGRFKVPTLRNVALTAPYMHNGYFKTLNQVVDFYNTRDIKQKCDQNQSAEKAELNNCWPKAERAHSVNHTELGNLRLSHQEVNDIIDFMKTLTDGYWTRESGWLPEKEIQSK